MNADPRTIAPYPTVDCPVCGAPANYACNADTEGEPRERPHAERRKAEAGALWQDLKGAAYDAKVREMTDRG